MKKFWKSWTIQFNAVALSVITALPGVKEQFPELQPYLDAQVYRYAMLVIVVANIALRFKTSTAIRGK